MINRNTTCSLDDAIDLFEESWSLESRASIVSILEQHGLDADLDALTELIRIDIELRYKQGISLGLNEYFDQWNDLLDRPAKVAEIAFEDFRARSAHGHDIGISRWRDLPGIQDEQWFQRLMLETSRSRLFQSSTLLGDDLPSDEPLNNRSDDAFKIALKAEGFRVVQQIGEGAFSKVYLATQSELADRYIVLKVVDEDLRESRSMATLQHTNIVPLYSVHRMHSRTLICMPYAGRVTLMDLLSSSQDGSATAGQSLVATVEARIDQTVSVFEQNRSLRTELFAPAADERAALKPLEMLRKLDRNDLTTWIFCRLAAALAHSHARGILHGDLKPSNVLIRNDGEPALLDFNLSQSLDRASSRVIGGTLPYMAPETYRALMMQHGQPQSESDIYALGVMMFQFLTGRLPHPSPPSMAETDLQLGIEACKQTPDWQSSTSIPVSLQNIVDRCLAFDPSDRYATADDLRADLENEHFGRSLVHAPEPRSVKVKKWIRRHPKSTSGGTVAALLLAFLLPLAAFAIQSRRTAQHMTVQRNANAFLDDSISGLSKINADPKRTSLANIERGTQILQQYGVLETNGYERLISAQMPAKDKQKIVQAIQRHVVHLGLLEAKRLRVAANKGRLIPSDFQRLDQLIQTVSELPLEGTSRSLLFLKASRANLAGDADFQHLEDTANSTIASGDSEIYLEGLRQLVLSRFSKARELFTALADRNSIPSLMRWTLLARSQYSDGDYESAKLSVTQSIQRDPESSNLRVFRGRCHMQLHEAERAIADFTKAIELNPRSRWGFVNRGMIYLGKKQYTEAIADYTKALEITPGDVYSLLKRAKAYRALDQADLAEQDFNAAMKSDVVTASSLLSRALAIEVDDPEAALSDLRRAMELDPSERLIPSQMATILSTKLHRYDEAVAMFDIVLQLKPNDERALVDRAISCVHLNRIDNAIDSLDKALIDPKEARTYYQAACAYALMPDLRNHQRAVTLLSQALHAGYSATDLTTDPDLDNIRSLDGFRAVERAYKISKRRPKASTPRQP